MRLGPLLGVALLAAAPALAPAMAQDDDPAALPGDDLEAKELVYYNCSACHSFKLVAQQGMSRERWDKLMHWMVEKQGMPEYPEDEWSAILDYLAAHYGEGGGGEAAPAFAETEPTDAGEAAAPDTSGFAPPSPYNN